MDALGSSDDGTSTGPKRVPETRWAPASPSSCRSMPSARGMSKPAMPAKKRLSIRDEASNDAPTSRRSDRHRARSASHPRHPVATRLAADAGCTAAEGDIHRRGEQQQCKKNAHSKLMVADHPATLYASPR